jgi:Xaa-Pro aminopeptidase
VDHIKQSFAKRKQAQDIMKELDVPCWVIFVADNRAEEAHLSLFGAPTGASYRAYILTQDKVVAVVHEIEADIQEQYGFDVSLMQGRNIVREVAETINILLPQDSPIALNYSFTHSGVDTVGFGRVQLFVEELNKLNYFKQEEKIVSADELIFSIASTKLPHEVKLLKEAAQLTNKVIQEGFGKMKSGMTEKEVAEVFHELVTEEMQKNKRVGYSWEKAGNPIVLTGEGIAGSPHIHPSDRVLRPGNTVYVDFGLSIDGFHGDMQHVGYVLRADEVAAPKEVQEKFDLVVRSIKAGMEAAVPGRQGWEVDKVCREIITDAGWPTYKHGTGHQLGQGATHAPGVAFGPKYSDYTNDDKDAKPSPVSTLPLREGYVMTIEPRIQVANGASIEIDGVIMKDGYESFVPIQEKIHLIQ